MLQQHPVFSRSAFPLLFQGKGRLLSVLLFSFSITLLFIARQGQEPAPYAAASAVQHYEYVFPDGGMDVFDIDNGFKQISHVSLPTSAGGRGVAVGLPTHMLYVAYGSDGSSGGQQLAYDLVADKVVWKKSYNHGIDSQAITPDGKTIYMPAGETSGSNLWYVESAATGNDMGSITVGPDPHDTVITPNGAHVYMGPRNEQDTQTYLGVASTVTKQITQKVGPFPKGIRPFTINREETLVYTSITSYLGFYVGSITTGKVLFAAPVQGFSCGDIGVTDPSHGIALSPHEKTIYIIDSPCSYVHVFDVSGIPHSAPKQIADIKLNHALGGNEQGCGYDCQRDGWLQLSIDGRYLFVGDSGDIIDTTTNKIVGFLPSLWNTRKELEIDWQNGMPIATSERQGLGYGTNSTGATAEDDRVGAGMQVV